MRRISFLVPTRRRGVAGFLLLCLCLTLSSAFSANVATPRVRVTADRSGTINQTVTGVSQAVSTASGSVGSPKMDVSTGTMDSSSSGNSEVIANAQAAGQLGIKTYTQDLTQTALLAVATPYIEDQASTLAAKLASYAQSNGLSFMEFNFDQEVIVQGMTGTAHLIWSMLVDANGKFRYGDPTIVPSTPTYIYAIYTSASVASGLPTGWTYPSAGTLSYEVLTIANNTVVQSWTSISTGGAFDPPQSTNGTVVDPDAGLKCLAGQTPSACSTVTNINTLLNQYGSSYAKVAYIRSVSPVYETNSGGTLSAVMSVDVTSRTWGYGTSCSTLSYTNTGTIGYELQSPVNWYLITPDTNYSLIATSTYYSQSPTSSYTYTTDISVSQLALLQTEIIDPSGQTLNLVSTASVSNLIYLAPLTQQAQDASSTVTVNSPTYEANGNYYQIAYYAVTASSVCAGGTRVAQITLTQYWTSGTLYIGSVVNTLADNTWQALQSDPGDEPTVLSNSGLYTYYDSSANIIYLSYPCGTGFYTASFCNNIPYWGLEALVNGESSEGDGYYYSGNPQSVNGSYLITVVQGFNLGTGTAIYSQFYDPNWATETSTAAYDNPGGNGGD